MRLTLVFIALMTLAAILPAAAAPVRLACGAKNTTWDYCQDAAQRWATTTGNAVEVIATPAESLDMLSYYQQQLVAESDSLDIVLIDALSLPLLYAYLLPLNDKVAPAELELFSKTPLADALLNGRLYGLPWYTDNGLLYYRQDLLIAYARPLPTTWEELLETGSYIASRQQDATGKNLYPFTFQGRVSESLTCNALEWLYSHYRLTDAETLSPLASLPADDIRNALTIAQRLLTTGSPPASLTYNEEDSRMLFQNGQAVFMRNWTYAWALLNQDDSLVQGKVGITALPAGADGKSVTVQGGWFFAINRATKHPEQALQLIRHLTSPQEQKIRTLSLGLQPTINSLFADPEILATQPHLAIIRDLSMRPIQRLRVAGTQPYPRFSNNLRQTVHDTLWGSISIDQAVQKLRAQPDTQRRRQ